MAWIATGVASMPLAGLAYEAATVVLKRSQWLAVSMWLGVRLFQILDGLAKPKAIL